MFGSKKKHVNGSDQELAQKVNEDLVVRNMPSIQRLHGDTPTSPAAINEGETLSRLASPKHNVKTVGLIIIASSVVFIGLLVYLSYIYIIKPQAKTNPETSTLVSSEPEKKIITDLINEQRASSSEEITMATTSLIATVTPNTLDLENGDASSTLMNEELSGKPDINLPPLLDTDGDGLNDEEESALGTDATLSDTNGNGYLDLVEINNNYNPVGTGRLVNNSSLDTYQNLAFNYSFLYPKAFSPSSLSDDSIIILTATDDSIIQISLQENTNQQSILGWYGDSFSEVTVTYDKLKSGDTWDGVWSEDGQNFYLTDKERNNIYIISYIPSVAGRLAYPNIFKLLINSLLIK